jgi:hypothetical protein
VLDLEHIFSSFGEPTELSQSNALRPLCADINTALIFITEQPKKIEVPRSFYLGYPAMQDNATGLA